ncbi:MAG: hypothetical protein EA424_16080, partial [Planctomycetaceae bacterium]
MVEVYPLTKADADAAMTVLKALVPTGNIVLDPNLNQINAHATPSQQTLIKRVLEQMEAGMPDEARPTLEVHAVGALREDAEAATRLLETLKSIVPKAQISWNADRQSLVAWATAADQETLKNALEKLNLDTSPRASRQLEVHRLRRVDPTPTLALFQSILPDALLHVDTQTRSLVARAVPEDHQVIRETLKILEPAEPSPDTPELRYYELTLAMPPDLPEAIQKVSPGSIVALDESGMRLMVIASPSEHKKIEKTVERMQQTNFTTGRPQLVIHKVTSDQRRRFDAVWPALSRELPRVEIMAEGNLDELAIWARPRQHEVIAEILEELESEIPDSERLKLATYSIAAGSLDSVLSMLKNVYPATKFVADTDAQRLMVWSTEQQHESIRESLESLQATGPTAATMVEIYPLTQADPSSTLTMLQSLLPDAKLSLDQQSENLVVMAAAEDHQVVSDTLAKMQPDQPGEHAARLLFYDVDKEPSTHLMGILENLAPRAQITYDAENERLAVVAAPAEHSRIEETLRQFYESVPARKPVLATYPLRAADAANVLTMLEKLYPDLQLLLDAKTDRLLVWGSADEQASIKESLEKLLGDGSPQFTPQLEVHRLTEADPDAALALLQKLLPDAQLTLDARTNSLMALAVPADQQVIRTTLEQLQAAATALDMPILRFHPLSREPSADLIKVLNDLVPKAEITSDAENQRLTIVAVPADHDRIQSVIEQFEGSTPPVEQPTLRIYPANKAQQQRLTAVLTQLAAQLPDVQVLPDASQDELAIWAKPTEHARIAEILERMGADGLSDQPPRLAAYTLKAAEPASVSELLDRLFPDVQVVIDENTRRVMVWATLEEQSRISEAIQQIDSGEPGDWQQEVRAYPLRGHDPSVVVEMLDQSLPNARFSSDPQAGTILAWGTGQEHEQIQRLVDQLTRTNDSAQRAVVYDLQAITAAAVVEVLEEAVPNAKLTIDDENPRRLTAWARSFEHEGIAAVLQDLDVPGDRQESTIEIYTIPARRTSTTFHQIQTLMAAFPQARFSTGSEPGQIIAWASPEEHEQIRALISRMKTPDADEAPKMVVYSLQSMDAEEAMKLLRTIVDSAELAVDPTDPHRMTAWAVPADHQRIEDALREIDGPQDPAQQGTRLEFYPFDEAPAPSLVGILEDLAPRARITFDEENLQLAVIASAADHDRISATLQQYRQVATTKGQPTLTVYPFRAADSAGVLAILEKLVPDAQLTLDAKNNLLALATAAEQQVIKAALEQLQSSATAPGGPVLRFHPLSQMPKEDLLAILQEMVPQAQITADPENERLTVVATPEDHEAITKIVAEFEASTPPAERAMLTVYPTTPAQQRRFELALAQLTDDLPSLQVLPNASPGELAIWATPSDHARVAELLKRLTGEVATDDPPRLAGYALNAADPQTVSELLERLFPDADIVIDEKARKVMVWASLADQARISDAIQQIDSGEPGAWQEELRAYPLRDADPTVLVQMLTQALPDMRITSDTRANTLLAWGSRQDHQQVQKLVQQLTQTPDTAQRAAVYDLKSITASSAQSILENAVPQAKLTLDPGNPQRLTAWARVFEHDSIAAILEEIDVPGDATLGSTVEVYSIPAVSTTSAIFQLRTLSTAFPQASFSLGGNIGQVVAWASARDHQQIQMLVERMKATAEEDAPTLVVYTLQHVDADQALEVLSKIVAEAQLNADPANPSRLSAWANPAEHQTIEDALAQLDVEEAAGTGSTAVIYSLEGMDAAAVTYTLPFLTASVPGARITRGAQPDQLLAWATAREHEQLKVLVDQLTREVPAEQAPRVGVYSLRFVPAATAAELLRRAVPKAEFSLDTAERGRLVAWASPTDQDTIRMILDDLDVEGEGTTADVQVYRLDGVTTAAAATPAISLMTSAFPNSRFSVGTTPGEIVAWASARDHAEIKQLVGRLNAGPPEDETPRAEVYSLKNITAADATTVLTNAVPRAKLTSDTRNPQRLTAWASPAEQATIQDIIEQIDVEGDPEASYSVAIYRLEGMSTRALYFAGTFLASAVPQARFTPGSEEGQLVAWATANDHRQIERLVEQMTAAPPEEMARQVEVYSLEHITGADAVSVLTAALPRATLTTTPNDPQRLTAWATPSDQKTVRAMLDKIDIETAPDSEATIAVYRLQSTVGAMTAVGLASAQRLLTSAFPRAQFSPGIEPGQLLAWATPKEQEGIRELIDELNAGPPPDEAPQAVVYTLRNINATNGLSILTTAVPQAKLTTDASDPQRLTAWATPADHANIEAILEQIDIEGDVDAGRTAVIYSLEDMDLRAMTLAYQFLASAVPDARFSPGAQPGQLMALANDRDHRRIGSLVEQLTQELPPDQAPTAAVYNVRNIQAASASSILAEAVPRAKVTIDPADTSRLTVWANPADQNNIRAILDQIDVEGEVGGASAEVYELEGALTTTAAAAALRLLGTAFPNARFSTGTAPSQIIAWASPADHAEIDDLVQRLNAGPPPDKAPQAVVYTLTNINATNGLSILTSAVPQAKLTTDASDPQRLTAWATPADHANIQAILEQIDIEGDVDAGRTAVIYSLEDMDLRAMTLAYQFLASAVPDARFSPGAQQGQLMALANDRDHRRIASLVEQLTQELPPDQAPTAAVYNVRNIQAASASSILAEAVPRAKFTVDPADTSRLTVWANPADQNNIRAILDQIDVEGEVGGLSAEVYQLEGDLTTTAAAAALRLLGTAFPNARFSTGTAPSQIIAWASVRDHAEIDDLVQRLNAGPPPDKAPGVVVYQLEFIEASQAQNVLQSAVPTASLTLDLAAPQRLTAWGTPEEHRTIEEVLAQIDVAEAAESNQTVVVYSLGDMNPRAATYVWRFLSNAVPNARLTPGAEPEQLVAWATPKDHQQLQMMIDQLTAVAPEDEPKIAVYTTRFVSAANAAKTLARAVPRAELTPDDEDPQRMTAWARPADHDNIRAILEQIDVEGDAEGARVEVYLLDGTVTATSAAYALRLLNTAFPRARFSMGTDPGQLVAWASPRDHVEIDQLVERLNAGLPPDRAPSVVVYPLEYLEATQAQTVLRSAVPQANLTVDPEAPLRLTAWATPDDHKVIETVLAKIDVEEATQSDRMVVIYSLRDINPRNVTSVLRFLAGAVPAARLTPGAEAEQLVAWASPKDHQQLEMLIDQLTTVPPEDEPSIAVYTTEFITAANASSILAAAVPRATLTPDADDSQRLTVWARATDHENIQQILQEIDVEGDLDSAATVEVYALQGRMTTTASAFALRLLGTAFSRARFSMGTDPGQIVAWATPRDHIEIAALIERLNAGPPDEIAPKAEIYTLEFMPAADAVTLLQRAVPGVVLTPDPRDPQRLTAWATPLEHQSIEQLVQQMDVETDPESAPTLQIYTLEGVDAIATTAALRVMSSAFPRITFSAGAETGQVLAMASPRQHVEIQKLVDQLNQPQPEEMAAKAVVYSLRFITAPTAQQTLQTALPQVKLTADRDEPQRLTAWARPSDHERIERILQEIDIDADPDSRPTPVVYSLEALDPRLAVTTLRYLSTAFPQAVISTGATQGQLIVFATPRDHEQMKQLVDQINQGPPPELAPTAKVYPLKVASPTAALQALTRAVPDATLSAAPDSNQIVAWARPTEHEQIAELLETLDQKGAAEWEPSAIVYSIEAADATEVARVLRYAVPQARITPGADPQQLVAWARPTDHELIEEIIQKMSETGPEETASRVVVYTLPSGDAASALAFLQSTVPAAQFSIGSDPRRLIAWARPADHQRIQRAVDEISEGAAEVTTQVYRFRYADPAAAMSVLTTLVPTVKMAVDRNEQSLVVSAVPEDHQRIREVVEAMDGEDADGQRPTLKVHRVQMGDVASVYRSLVTLFRTDPTVQISMDTRNDSVIAIASENKHQRIEQMIQAVAEAALEDADMAMELYPTRNLDSTAAMRILGQMLDRKGARAELSYDFYTNQLIAIAKPEYQELIRETLDQLRGEEPLLEIYELQFVDPMSAELAISRQFADEGLFGPEVDTDPVTDQLFVRATADQHQSIRDLLVKMGETQLRMVNGRDGRAMRTLRVQGNVADALLEIQRLWPRLRENELRVISPGTPMPETPAVEPAKPVEPVEPAEPAEPADTADPIDPIDPIDADDADDA